MCEDYERAFEKLRTNRRAALQLGVRHQVREPGTSHDRDVDRKLPDAADAYPSAGTVGNPREMSVRKDVDLGYNNTGIIVDIPGHGTYFCRGVSNNLSNPEMAFVLCGTTVRSIADKYAFKGLLGKWEDICQ